MLWFGLLSAVEVSLNDLYAKSHASVARLDYLSVMIVVPLVLLLAATASTSLKSLRRIYAFLAQAGLFFRWCGFDFR